MCWTIFIPKNKLPASSLLTLPVLQELLTKIGENNHNHIKQRAQGKYSGYWRRRRRLYRSRLRKQVVAIDNSQEELAEAPGGFEKVFMDATNLKYENDCFGNVTFFYTLMYMTALEQAKAISEAARVLKSGGTLAIWDCEIASAYPDPFFVDVDVLMDGQKYHTTYGIIKRDAQDREQIELLCSKVGLRLVNASSNAKHFNLYYEKDSGWRDS